MFFRQIWLKAMGLSVSVSLCVSVTIVNTGYILGKIKNVKMTFVDFDICH